MDLWIRSQSKKTLTKVNAITLNSCNNDYVIEDEKGYMLGKYSKERALKVLYEIQDFIMINNSFDLYAKTGSFPQNFTNQYSYTSTYQMPKD